MKNILKFTFVLFLSLNFFSCSEDTDAVQIDLVDNSENINKLINSFDVLVKKSIQNPSLSNEKLGELFIEESRNRGLSIFEVNTNSFAKTSEETSTFSIEYLAFSSQIQNANSFLTKEEYKTSLTQLNSDVLNSTISIEEKQILVDNIGFMNAFVDWMDTLETQTANKSSFLAKSDCDGWWSCWGKCAAGTIGGAGAGALAGAVAPAAGCTLVLPVIGTVACGTVGGIVGGISGGLTGAAASCD